MTSRPFCHRKVSTRKVLGLERRVRRIFFSYRSFLFGLMLCTCSYAVYMFAVCINLLLYWPHGGRWSRLTSHWPGHMCSFHGTFEARRPVRDRYGLGPTARMLPRRRESSAAGLVQGGVTSISGEMGWFALEGTPCDFVMKTPSVDFSAENDLGTAGIVQCVLGVITLKWPTSSVGSLH